MDNLKPDQRKKNMSRIKSTGTLPEKIVMKELRKRKIYFAKNVKSIFGKPDIVFRRKKTAVFIDSDFWHCNKKRFIQPKSNTGYWKTKISNNIKRDKLVNKTLKKQGWKVIRIWEYDIKHRLDKCIKSILDAIEN
jgi:DNA mismatch endonuclease Vsr